MEIQTIVEKFSEKETFEKEGINVHIFTKDNKIEVYELEKGDSFNENNLEFNYNKPKSYIKFDSKNGKIDIFVGDYWLISLYDNKTPIIDDNSAAFFSTDDSFIELKKVYELNNKLFAIFVKMLMINNVTELNKFSSEEINSKINDEYVENTIYNIKSFSSKYFIRFAKYGKEFPIPFGNDDYFPEFYNTFKNMEDVLKGNYVSSFIRKFILYRLIEIFNIDITNERYIGILDGNVLSSTALKYWELINDDKSTAEELFNIAMITLHKQKWNGFMSEYKSFNKAFDIAVKKKRNTLKGMCYIVQNVKKNRIREAFITIFSAMEKVVEKGEFNEKSLTDIESKIEEKMDENE